MFTKLQLVLLGVVVFQGADLSASEKSSNSPRRGLNSPRSPRNPLSCSQEARQNGDLAIAALKRSLEVRKEENQSSLYYPWPGANPVIENNCSKITMADQMKPWCPYHW